MQYDLDLVNELCNEVGFKSFFRESYELLVELDSENLLLFSNFDYDDCLIGFEGTDSHFHGDATFSNPQGNYTDVCYLDIISGLAEGSILVYELRENGEIQERGLLHSMYICELESMESSEIITIKCFKKG